MLDRDPCVLALALDSQRSAQVINYAGRAARAGITTVLVVARPVAPMRSTPTLRVVDLLTPEKAGSAGQWARSRVARKLAHLRGRDPSHAAMWDRMLAGSGYRQIRPFLLWRLLRRHGDLDLSAVTHVVVGGQDAWPIAWHVAQLNPDVVVGPSLDVQQVLERARTAR